ncbi:MAG: winged helix-turn-helix domain-containing protein [Actinobacteria bacterium]|nr:winged helix-turn-helix domain-containing protein [Actinomycetota bacterium]
MRAPRVKALPRERLHGLLATVWQHRLALVVAPAGSGKTTLLSQFAAGTGMPVAWYRAEPADASAAAAVAHLERGLVAAFGLTGGWSDVDDAIEALDHWEGDRGLIAVDDLHALWGTEAEATLERLLEHLPPGIAMVAATRRAPGFNLSRLRVSDQVIEMGPEELRFRSWEVERLFHDFYGEPLPPDEQAELARRTEGWAAGLQLFHLATRGKTASERRRVLHELGVRSRLVREYLARNVLDELPLHVRDFLLQTCVLGRLTPALCDALTGATSGSALLAELEQRQIFTAAMDDEGAYRYHEVLRSHLEAVLLETVGELEARARYRRAGQLLESHGHLPEALRAYCHAADWEAASGLLGGRGEQVIDKPGEWIEALPAALLDQDPWLLLAWARRNVALGRWRAAIEAYDRAEAASAHPQPAETIRRERQALAAWFEEPVPVPTDWTSLLRRAVVRDPAGLAQREAARFTGAGGALASGIASLLAGHVGAAATRLDAVASRADATPALALGARTAAAVARLLAGRSGVSEGPALMEAAEDAGIPWLGALVKAVADVESGCPDQAAEGLSKDDEWGRPLAQLLWGLGALCRGQDAPELLLEAAEGFDAVGASVLEAWARAGAALAMARAGDADAALHTNRAAAAARQSAAPGPVAVVGLASALLEHGAGSDPAARAAGVLVRLGLCFGTPPVTTASDSRQRTAPATASPAHGLELRCFGPLVAHLDGEPLELSSIKPRVRSLLRLLALHAGRPVHRDHLVDCLWPSEGDARVGTRNLQVAISSLRQLLEPGVARGAAAVVVREGDTYRLAVGPGALDLALFDAHLAAAGLARSQGDHETAGERLARALDLYRGELLADEGAAEWVLAERERYRLQAADASHGRAAILLGAGQPQAAATEADRGLRIDPYRDDLWRLLISAHHASGDPAAASKAQRRYDTVLRDLGLSPSS